MTATGNWYRIAPVATFLVILLLGALQWYTPSAQEPSIRLLHRRDLLSSNRNITARANNRNDAIPGWSPPLSTLLSTPFDQLDAKGKAVVVGKGVVCMLDEDPGSSHSPQSSYTETSDLARTRYGWSYTRIPLADHEDDELGAFGFHDAFVDLSISEDKALWNQVSVAHTSKSISNGKNYPPTWGTYQSLFNLRDGVMIATQNYGPVWMNERDGSEIPPNKIIPLRQWSDLVYLTLKKTIEDIGTGDIGGINHICRHNIVNDGVKQTLAMITGGSSIYDYPPKWPGLSYPITENQALATLSTANGKGVGYFLATHKGPMGIRAIDRVNIFNCPSDDGDSQWCVYFHIVDGPLAS